MNFVKMEGLGNDYIYVNCLEEDLKCPSKVAKYISNRHFGIGSDGLILIKKSDQADFKMEIYNSDGSKAQMCGNGIRCLAKYVYEKGLTDKKCLTIETDSGNRFLSFLTEYGEVKEVSVDMGTPEFNCNKIPMFNKRKDFINQVITLKGIDYNATAVSIGNPHLVIFVESLENLDIESMAKEVEETEMFPEGINIEFVKVIDQNNISLRVLERGSGETLACGTGACAATVASVLASKTSKAITVHLLGGKLLITFDDQNNLVYMKGSAKLIYEGNIELENHEDFRKI